jgi:hypothetical protein
LALGRYGFEGTFIMNDGSKIIGNNGSGVFVIRGGTFSMRGGEISGNTGGGVVVSITFYSDGRVEGGTFRISNGRIYGSNEPNASLRNTATNGAALSVSIGTNYPVTAQRGTFSGSTWIRSGDLSTTNNTIRVVNGNLQ